MAKKQQKLIKSKQRVKKYGEVYTPDKIVEDMCDCAEPKVSDIRATVLEPAVGTGNFLVEVMQRRIKKSKQDKDVLVALSNIYGIDILKDNIEECRERLYEVCKNYSDEENFLKAAKHILSKNIILGDFINGQDKITITQFTELDDGSFGETEHTLAELMEQASGE